jgi:hypothetical protein
LAVAGGSPIATSADNVKIVPPPAMALIALAERPESIRAMMSM